MRNEIVSKYVEKYSLKVKDVENSLESYNSFFKNMGFKESIEGMIRKRLREKVFVRVMDLGCGNGGFLADLKKIFEDEIHTIGADLLVPDKAPDETLLGDCLTQEFPKEIDFIFSFRTLHEVGEPEKMVEKVHSSLAKGGKAFLSFRTMDLYIGSKGIAEIGEKETKQLSRMVSSGKLKGFSVGGFEVSVKNDKNQDVVAGVNVFLEK